MKYEFHVGDYVETKDGRVGYITQVAFSNEVKRWCSMRIMCRQNDAIINFEGYEDLILDRFNRIGQYDFTKKDEGKIEPLAEEYTKSFPVYKATITMNDSEWFSIDIGAMGKKINELVDAVNRLEEKVNGN